MSAQPDQQAQLEQIVTRIARRAADAGAAAHADLCVRLALAQETAEGQAQALVEKDRQLADKDADLARAHLTVDELRARMVELEATAAAMTV